MSTLFPTRCTQQAFLQQYKALPDGKDEDGIDLFADSEDDEDYVPLGDEQELEEMIDANADDGAEDDSAHKDFDAAQRSAEDKAVEELARRFEERHARYAEPDREAPRAGAFCTATQKAARKAAKAAEAAERKAAEAAAAEAKAKEAKQRKARREAMNALYDMLEDDTAKANTKATPPTTSTPPVAREPQPSCSSAPYRIKKRKMA